MFICLAGKKPWAKSGQHSAFVYHAGASSSPVSARTLHVPHPVRGQKIRRRSIVGWGRPPYVIAPESSFRLASLGTELFSTILSANSHGRASWLLRSSNPQPTTCRWPEELSSSGSCRANHALTSLPLAQPVRDNFLSQANQDLYACICWVRNHLTTHNEIYNVCRNFHHARIGRPDNIRRRFTSLLR
jgi:hypothetical protein